MSLRKVKVKRRRIVKERRFYAVKVLSGNLLEVLSLMEEVVEKRGLKIYSIIYFGVFGNIVFVEAEGLHSVSLLRAYLEDKGVILTVYRNVILFKNLKPLLSSFSGFLSIKEGDIVEIVYGSLRGLKGVVVRVEEDSIDIQLLEGVCRRIVTVDKCFVRVIKSAGTFGMEKEETVL